MALSLLRRRPLDRPAGFQQPPPVMDGEGVNYNQYFNSKDGGLMRPTMPTRPAVTPVTGVQPGVSNTNIPRLNINEVSGGVNPFAMQGIINSLPPDPYAAWKNTPPVASSPLRPIPQGVAAANPQPPQITTAPATAPASTPAMGTPTAESILRPPQAQAQAPMRDAGDLAASEAAAYRVEQQKDMQAIAPTSANPQPWQKRPDNPSAIVGNATSGRGLNVSPELRATIPSGLEAAQPPQPIRDMGLLRSAGTREGMSGEGLAHLFPKTYGKENQDWHKEGLRRMRGTFDSPILRKTDEIAASNAARAGILRQQNEQALKIAQAENPVAPKPILMSKERWSEQTGKDNKTSGETTQRFTPDGRRINPMTDQPFTKAELKQDEVDSAASNVDATIAEVTGGGLTKYKGNDKAAQAKIDASIKDAVVAALGKPPTPAGLEAIHAALAAGKTMAEIIAEFPLQQP